MNKELIDKFLRNECSPEEEQQVSQYLLESQDGEDIQQLMQHVWDAQDDETENDVDKKRLFEGIINDIIDEKVPTIDVHQKALAESPVKDKLHQMSVANRWVKVAAVILLALGLTYVFYSMNETTVTPVQVASEIEKYNPSGQRSRIVLRDGTKIFLNAESKITYSDQEYGVEFREVYLEGEAYFEVAKNPDVPFLVKTAKLSTTALGTAFNVRAFKDENRTQVSLAEGKVKVVQMGETREASAGIILSPDEEVIFESDNMSKRAFDPNRVLSWKDGVIYFQETDFQEAIETLERWYNVKFEIRNLENLDGLKGTGTFKNETLENVLKALSYSLEFKYEINQDNVIINF
ncbi:MAG: DUF4974 domain-containing protein [Cyclobacteriaceae bacterium]